MKMDKKKVDNEKKKNCIFLSNKYTTSFWPKQFYLCDFWPRIQLGKILVEDLCSE